MSWDAYLECDSCGHEVGWWNYTYNTTPMVCAAAEVAGIDFHGFQKTLAGMTGPDGAAMLAVIASEMRSRPTAYQAMNPPNGWGTYVGILGVMSEMVGAVPESPTHWRVT